MTPLYRAAGSAALFFALATHAMAQVTSGTILGAVTDSSGGVLPGVTVAATNLETGLVHSTRTDAAGAYTLANIPIGRYQLRMEMSGFRTKLVGPLTLVVDQRLRVDVALELGDVAETMEVRGRATLLQTDQPDMNQIVQDQKIKALPLNGRDFF